MSAILAGSNLLCLGGKEPNSASRPDKPDAYCTLLKECRSVIFRQCESALTTLPSACNAGVRLYN